MLASGRDRPTFPAALVAWVLCVLAGAAGATAQNTGPGAATTARPAPPVARAADPTPRALEPPARAVRRENPKVPNIEPGGHGWFTLPAGPNRGTALLHLPPRPPATGAEPGVNAERARNAEGVVRFAPGFSEAAEFVAWWQNRVYIAVKADRTAPIGQGDFRQRILTLSAFRSAAGGWEYPPGRPELAASLPARAVEMVAFGACRLGPVALMRHTPRAGTKGQWIVPIPSHDLPEGGVGPAGAPKSGDLELLLYTSSRWHRLTPPWSGDGAAGKRFSKFWLEGEGDAIILEALDPAAPEVREFRLSLPLTITPGNPDIDLPWKEAAYPLKVHSANTDLEIPLPDLVCRVEGAAVAVAWTPENRGEVRLFWLRPNRPAEEGPAVEDVPAQHVVVPMDGSGRIAVVWPDAGAGASAEGQTGGGQAAEPELAAPGSNRTGLEVCEVSATTGKPLYRGPLRSDYWLSTREYQVLVAMLVVVMGAVLVFVLRTEPTPSAALPRGVSLAEPSRRFLAAVIDYLPAALLVESLFSLPTGTLLLPSQMIGQPFTIWALLTAFGLSAAHATVGEWLFGRSLGKLLTGCVVVSVRPRAAGARPAGEHAGPAGAAEGEQPLSRPVFWQCLVRNLVKWLAPILGLFMLVDVNRRHPGDLIAKTLVLMTEPEPGDQP